MLVQVGFGAGFRALGVSSVAPSLGYSQSRGDFSHPYCWTLPQWPVKGPLTRHQTGEGNVLSSAGITVPGKGSPRPALLQGLASGAVHPEPSSSGGITNTELPAAPGGSAPSPRAALPANPLLEPAPSPPSRRLRARRLRLLHKPVSVSEQPAKPAPRPAAPRWGVSTLAQQRPLAPAQHKPLLLPGLGFQAAPPRVSPLDFTAPPSSPVPVPSSRGARAHSPRVLPGSGAPSQLGAAGSEGGIWAFIAVSFTVGFFFSCLVCPTGSSPGSLHEPQ